MVDDARWGGLVEKVRAACVVKAASIIGSASPGGDAKTWAIACLGNPASVANQIVFAVIGVNAAVTVDQIFQAADSLVQAAVDSAVDKLYGV